MLLKFKDDLAVNVESIGMVQNNPFQKGSILYMTDRPEHIETDAPFSAIMDALTQHGHKVVMFTEEARVYTTGSGSEHEEQYKKARKAKRNPEPTPAV